MSKLFYERLSPRDMACIEYGRKLAELDYVRTQSFQPFWDYELEMRRDALDAARAARNRIFRLCGFCKHTGHGGSSWCEHAQDYVHMKEDLACTCPHYEERREA